MPTARSILVLHQVTPGNAGQRASCQVDYYFGSCGNTLGFRAQLLRRFVAARCANNISAHDLPGLYSLPVSPNVAELSTQRDP